MLLLPTDQSLPFHTLMKSWQAAKQTRDVVAVAVQLLRQRTQLLAHWLQAGFVQAEVGMHQSRAVGTAIHHWCATLSIYKSIKADFQALCFETAAEPLPCMSLERTVFLELHS
jgi:hypothetical protein